MSHLPDTISLAREGHAASYRHDVIEVSAETLDLEKLREHTRAASEHLGDNIEMWAQAFLDSNQMALALWGLARDPRAPTHLKWMADFVLDGVEHWETPSELALVVSTRVELLGLLARERCEDETITEHILEHLDLYSGWMREVRLGASFQLGEDNPWHKSGAPFQETLDALSRGKKPAAQGMTQLSRERYMELARLPVTRLLLEQQGGLSTLCEFIALYTRTSATARALSERADTLERALLIEATALIEEQEPVTTSPEESLLATAPVDDGTPFYLGLTGHQDAFPTSFSTVRLAALTRVILRKLGADHEAWSNTNARTVVTASDLPRLDDAQRILYARIVTSFMGHDLSMWEGFGLGARAVARRSELLTTLARSERTASARRDEAMALVIKQLAFFGGWDEAVARGERYQLGVESPWHKAGEFARVQRILAQNLDDPERLTELGFTRIPRQHYLDRVRLPVSQLLLGAGEPLAAVAALITLFTASRNDRSDIFAAQRAVRDDLFLQATNALKYQSTPIPRNSLFGLTREAGNMSTFFKQSMRVSLDDDPKMGRLDDLEEAALVLQERVDDNGQSLMFIDRKLIERRKGAQMFVEVPLEERSSNVIDALTRAIEQLPIEPEALEHIPRITAAFFGAAQRDRHADFGKEGQFWDTSSGKRIARLAGFNPDNPRHRNIVQSVRALMERVILHREVVTRDETGRHEKVKWSGNLIALTNEKIEIERSDREGLTSHSTFQAYSIAAGLWRMVVPSGAGGAPSFLALDERAFHLDQSSSVPFNIYWSLINRAYMQRLDPHGRFEVKVGTIYSWAGLAGSYKRPSRLRERLINVFDLMIDHGLLDSWSCELLSGEEIIPLDTLLEATITITFSTSQLTILEHLREPRAVLEG